MGISRLSRKRTTPGINFPNRQMLSVAGNVPNIASQNAALQSTALTGKAYKFHGLSNDQMTWTCTAGTGLLTTAAPGEFQVTLTVQPVDDSSNETELGLRRQPAPGNKPELTADYPMDRAGVLIQSAQWTVVANQMPTRLRNAHGIAASLSY